MTQGKKALRLPSPRRKQRQAQTSRQKDCKDSETIAGGQQSPSEAYHVRPMRSDGSSNNEAVDRRETFAIEYLSIVHPCDMLTACTTCNKKQNA